MALRIPIPLGLRPARNKVPGEIRMRITPIKASDGSLKQRSRPNPNPSIAPATAKEFASRINHEMAVLELERLFKTGEPPELKISGPGNSAGSGFSGRPVRVAYQGFRGSYCQEAATKAFSACNAFPCNQMEDAFQALVEKTAERAIIPVENSIDGVIDRNFDLLLRHKVNIVGELILPVNHCLLAFPTASTSDLRRIVSHPQALSHCKTRLESLDLEIEEVSNVAEAAQFISENRISDTAVIGSKMAAKEFGLQVIEQNFQDRIGNFNRFLQLGLDPVLVSREKTGPWKTTVAFSLHNGVTDLFRALWQFESRDITVTRVEHRPNRSNPVRVEEKEEGCFRYFDYVFIIDVEGCLSDSGVERALGQLREITGFLRVLGSYTCG